MARSPAIMAALYAGAMKVVGYIVLALVAFFVVKSILSWLVSVLITIALVAGAISLITYFVKQKTA